MIGHLVKRIRDEQALDATYDREMRRSHPTRIPKGDSFDDFCRRQRARLGHRMESAVTRVLAARDDEDVFESRK